MHSSQDISEYTFSSTWNIFRLFAMQPLILNKKKMKNFRWFRIRKQTHFVRSNENAKNSWYRKQLTLAQFDTLTSVRVGFFLRLGISPKSKMEFTAQYQNWFFNFLASLFALGFVLYVFRLKLSIFSFRQIKISMLRHILTIYIIQIGDPERFCCSVVDAYSLCHFTANNCLRLCVCVVYVSRGKCIVSMRKLWTTSTSTNNF